MSNTTLFQRGHVVTDGEVKVEDLLVVGDNTFAKGVTFSNLTTCSSKRWPKAPRSWIAKGFG